MKKKQYLCTRFQKMGLNLPPESEVTVVTARIAELETDRRRRHGAPENSRLDELLIRK